MERKFFVETGVGQDDMSDYLIAMLYDARSTTLKYIKGISQEELDWQPYEGWNSVGALLSHIISTNHLFKTYLIEKREWTEDEKKQYQAGFEMGTFLPELKGKPVE